MANYFFGGLWYQGQTTTHVQENLSCLGLAAEGGKANNTTPFLNMSGFLASAPQASTAAAT